MRFANEVFVTAMRFNKIKNNNAESKIAPLNLT